MGLLSDPEAGGGGWARVLVRAEGAACACAWLAALAWLLALAHSSCNNPTYFSENALLPGLVRSDFTDERLARNIYNELLHELQDKYSQLDDMPVPWLVGKMSQLHLEVYTHNFTLRYPLGRAHVYTGTNVYGILRAPRTSSLEALVVSVPYRSLSTYHKGTAAGLALMLAFAHLARPHKYWAKDIIFVVTEHEQLGMQAWLEAYHGAGAGARDHYSHTLGALGAAAAGGAGAAHGGPLRAGELRARSGAIQAAINLEIHAPNIKYVEVKVEGLNGQLPNLDLVNLVNKMCVKSGLQHAYRGSYSWVSHRSERARWTAGLRTMLGQISTQLSGVPNGNHGLFHRYGIEAVTLEGRDADEPDGAAPRVASLSPANFHRLGAALEGTLRSLNNLLERFHQSYFFYLLVHTDRFVSIGQYMPCLCLLCGALLVRALALWISLQQDEDGEGEPAAAEAAARDSWSALSLAADYLAVHAAGYLIMTSPMWLSAIGADVLGLRTEQSVYWGAGGLAALAAAASGAAAPRAPRGELLAPALLELATLCLAVGVHNFALGLALAALYTPLALLVTPARRAGRLGWAQHRGKQALCVLLHPLCVLTAALALYSLHLFPDESVAAGVARGLGAAQQALLFSIVDSMVQYARGYSPLSPLLGWARHRGKQALCVLLHPLCVLTAALALYSLHLFPDESAAAGVARGLGVAQQALLFSIVDSMVQYARGYCPLSPLLGWARHRGKQALCVLLHPLCVLTAALALYSLHLFPDESAAAGVARGLGVAQQALLFSIVDSMVQYARGYSPLSPLLGWARHRGKQALCVLLHPLCVLTAALVLYSLHLFPDESAAAGVARGLGAAQQALLFSIVDFMVQYARGYSPLSPLLGWARHRGKQALCVLLHPLCLLTAALALYSLHLFPDESAAAGVARGLGAAQQALLFSIVDSMVQYARGYSPLSPLLGWARHRGKQALCVLLHPLCLLTAALALYSLHLFPDESVAAGVARGLGAAQQALLFSIVDSMVQYARGYSPLSPLLGWARHRGKQALCVLLHPLCVLTAALALYSLHLFPDESVAAGVARGLGAAQQALLFSIVDSMIYGNWLFNVTCLLVLPVWTIFWQTLCAASAAPPAR